MAAPKRTDFQRENDYVTIAEMYLKGVPQMVIAGKLALSQPVISRDIATIKERWSKSSILDFNEAKQRELARIDVLERTYWQAWERSCQIQERKTQRKRVATKAELGFDEASKQSEERDGNPAFLDGVMKCIMQRCAIFGINAAVRIAPADWRDEAKQLGGNPDTIKQLALAAFSASLQQPDAGGGEGLPQAISAGQD